MLAAPGCASRGDVAATVAKTAGMDARIVATDRFDILSYQRTRNAGSPLTVYIEGDGYAWVTPSRPSTDPTPKDPIALRLAAADPAANAGWLARPCQYTGGAGARGCNELFWTEGRYAEDVVAATAQAIDRMKAEAGAARLRLVGYSGGGAIAALVAARRRDVDLLVTVAGMLDGEAWARSEGLTPLWRSLDPARATTALAGIRQIHFIGADDRDIPASVARAFAERFGAGHAPPVVEVAGQDHRCCWTAIWPSLLARAEREARLP